MLNLALGGMGLRFRDPVNEDEILRLRFQLPGTTTVIHAQGEIAWADPQGGVGVRFVSLAGNSRVELEKWIQARAGTVN